MASHTKLAMCNRRRLVIAYHPERRAELDPEQSLVDEFTPPCARKRSKRAPELHSSYDRTRHAIAMRPFNEYVVEHAHVPS